MSHPGPLESAQRTQKTLYTLKFIPMKQVFPCAGCLPSLSCLLEATTINSFHIC